MADHFEVVKLKVPRTKVVVVVAYSPCFGNPASMVRKLKHLRTGPSTLCEKAELEYYNKRQNSGTRLAGYINGIL